MKIAELGRCAMRAVATAGLLTSVGCNESTTSGLTPAAGPATNVRFAGPGRKDTPWQRMPDDELRNKVTEAKGRVFIGFKRPTALGGVDEHGRVLVDEETVRGAKDELRAAGIEIDYEFKDMPTVVARVNGNRVGWLRNNPRIDYVEPLFPGKRSSQTTPWNVQRIGAPTVWSSTTGDGAKLLIIDSGIETSHPDLAASVVQTCMPYPDTGEDTYGHGTAMAGIVAATNNTAQIVGVAHGVALWMSKDGDEFPDPAYTACSIQFGRTNNVHVMSLSTAYSSSYTAITDQINSANSSGIIVVAAAGNEGGCCVMFPANLAAVIAVSATDTNNVRSSFTSTGAKVEVVAPGATITNNRGIQTACLGGTSCTTFDGAVMQGTSIATPHVAAAAALLKAYNSGWSNVEIRRRLRVTATDLGTTGHDNLYGYGLVNVAAALSAAAAAPPTVSIDGPSAVRPNEYCGWTSSVSGGVPPYTYDWRVNDLHKASTSYLDYQNTGSNFVTSLTVRGADEGETTQYLSVSVSGGAPLCVS